jgi:hypothetical protein
MAQARVVVMVVMAVAVGGCSALDALFGDAAAPPPAAADRTDVFYAGVDGLEMHSLPTATSDTLARLALHQPVSRIGFARGYANVSTEAGVVGWVDNANLLWRLPATPAVAAVADQAPATPVPPTWAAQAPTAAVEPTPGEQAPEAAPPTTTPAAQPTRKSIFSWIVPEEAPAAPVAPTPVEETPAVVPAAPAAPAGETVAPTAAAPVETPLPTEIEPIAAPPTSPPAAPPTRKSIFSIFSRD